MRFVVALLLFLPPVRGQEKVNAEILTRHLAPSQVMKLLSAGHTVAVNGKPASPLPPGIDSAFAADAKMRLVVHGRPDAVARLREMVKLLDVAPRAIRLKFRLLKFTFHADASWDVDIIGQPEIRTVNSVPASISVSGAGGYSVSADPSIVAGGVAVRGEVRIGGTHLAFSRRVAAGKRWVIAGHTDSPQAEIQKSVQAGQMPLFAADHTSYYVQLIATLDQPKK